ncbi:MAG: DUF86 domain-containing protein [Euryarchaeota archaeon]|nr:DUF86 domain-containing protein [Euryarchaeota archaeon]
MDKERILAKLDEMEQYLGELQSIVPDSFEEYAASMGTRRAAERLLQITIEAVMDTCALLVKELKLGLPSAEEEFVEKLKGRVLEPATVENLKRMKSFRNLLVHGYAKIEDQKVFEILEDGLEDFKDFKTQVLKFLKSCMESSGI